jgi:Fe-Mn family superoxide dismutase
MSKTLDLNLNDLVKTSVKSGIKSAATSLGLAEENNLNEAYVVQQQTFTQVSDNVSQKTKDAHTNLYKGYVESLNKISAELDAADRADVNSRYSKFRSLKMDETFNANGAMLHELYFANCFDPHSEIFMDSLSFMRLQRDFGTFDDWQRDFIACALSAREGWAVTGYSFYLKKFVNTVIDLHSENVMLQLHPVIVVDMWSHAYFRDYLDDKKSYIVAVLKELNWNVIEKRFKAVEEMSKILKTG